MLVPAVHDIIDAGCEKRNPAAEAVDG